MLLKDNQVVTIHSLSVVNCLSQNKKKRFGLNGCLGGLGSPLLYLVTRNPLRPAGRPDHKVNICHHLIVEHD